MKTIIKSISIALIALAILTNCNKEEVCDACEFNYPDSGFFGLNILNLDDTVYLAADEIHLETSPYYSMKAYLPASTSKLRVTIEGKSIALHRNQGWLTDLNQGSQYYVFQAEGQIVADLQIYFIYPGEATIKIYEDDFNTFARQKVIYLE